LESAADAKVRPAFRRSPEREAEIRAAHQTSNPEGCSVCDLLTELDATRADLQIHQSTSDFDAGVHFASHAAEDMGMEARQEVEALKAALEDFAAHGLRHDLHPTHSFNVELFQLEQWWLDYLKHADEMVRERARTALAALPAASADPAAPEAAEAIRGRVREAVKLQERNDTQAQMISAWGREYEQLSSAADALAVAALRAIRGEGTLQRYEYLADAYEHYRLVRDGNLGKSDKVLPA